MLEILLSILNSRIQTMHCVLGQMIHTRSIPVIQVKFYYQEIKETYRDFFTNKIDQNLLKFGN